MDTQEQIEVGSMNISELPDEILLNIFQHLSFKDLGRCCLLCQKFRQIASDKAFWESISINQDDPTYLSTLPTSFIEQALRLGTAYLNLNNAVLNGPSNFDQISNNLKYLSVKCADRKLKSNQLNELLTFITFDPKHLLLSTDCLEKLSLDLLTVEIVDGILKNSKTLKVLNLSQGYKGYYHSIPLPENTKKIATECTELEEFSLSLYEVDDDEIFMDFFCNNLTPNLKKIGLVGEISKTSLLSLVSRCNKLSELSLHESDISDEGMDIIIQHLSGTLEKLDVGGGRYPVKVQKLIQLPKLKMFWCQDNEFLDPDFESIEELAVLKEQMPHLQINGANLVQLWKLTDELQLINKKGILCHSGRKWILPIEGLIPSGGEIKDEVTGQFFKFNDDCKATFVTQKFGKGYLGFGHYGATHGSKWIRSQPDADGWFTLVMAHGHQGTRQFLTAKSSKCTIISDRKLNIACPMDAYLWNPQLHTKGLWEIQSKFKNRSYPVKIQRINS